MVDPVSVRYASKASIVCRFDWSLHGCMHRSHFVTVARF